MNPHDGAPPPAPAAPLGPAAVHRFFVRYEREFNRGLQGEPDTAALAELYADAFIGAAPAGVAVGHNDAGFARATAQGFRRYRSMGMQRMELEDVTVAGIDALHALAHTQWTALYATEAGEKAIRFTNAYLMRIDAQGALKVFGWVTGDEEQALREHGITGRTASLA